jgi:hypothetical protein
MRAMKIFGFVIVVSALIFFFARERKNSAQLSSTEMPKYISEVQDLVGTFSRPVDLFHWQDLAAMIGKKNLDPEKLDPKDRRVREYIRKQSLKFWSNSYSHDSMGNGLYFATDPFSTLERGGGLLKVTVKAGVRFLNTSGYSDLRFSGEALAEIKSAKCDISSLNDFFESSNTNCSALLYRLLKTLNVNMIFYNYGERNFEECPNRPQVAAVIYSETVLDPDKTRIYDGELFSKAAFESEDFRMINAMFKNLDQSDREKTYFWENASTPLPQNQIKTYLDNSIFGCGDHDEDFGTDEAWAYKAAHIYSSVFATVGTNIDVSKIKFLAAARFLNHEELQKDNALPTGDPRDVYTAGSASWDRLWQVEQAIKLETHKNRPLTLETILRWIAYWKNSTDFSKSNLAGLQYLIEMINQHFLFDHQNLAETSASYYSSVSSFVVGGWASFGSHYARNSLRFAADIYIKGINYLPFGEDNHTVSLILVDYITQSTNYPPLLFPRNIPLAVENIPQMSHQAFLDTYRAVVPCLQKYKEEDLIDIQNSACGTLP